MAWNYRNLWFWRLDVWNQGVDRAMLSQKALGENSFLPLSSFWWLSAIFGIPWFIDASIQFFPLSSHHLFPSVSVSVSFLPFLQWHWSYWIPSPFCSNRRWNPNVSFTSIHYIFKGPISKQVWVLRFWERHESEEDIIQLSTPCIIVCAVL